VLLAQFVCGNPDDPPELHVAGSWRRGAAQVGDLDIVIVSDSGSLTGDSMSPGLLLPTIVQWDRHGDRIAQGTMPLEGEPVGLHVDVWACTRSQFGAMLTFATGSHDTNLRMRSMAKRKGLALSQNGLFDRATGEQLDDGTEAGIFNALGYRWLAPEER
jgi:DNA polymerase (family 10)